jgi:hypothetical protein
MAGSELKQDKFYDARTGEEIDPHFVTVVRDDTGTIIGYVIHEVLQVDRTMAPTDIIHHKAIDQDTETR